MVLRLSINMKSLIINAGNIEKSLPFQVEKRKLVRKCNSMVTVVLLLAIGNYIFVASHYNQRLYYTLIGKFSSSSFRKKSRGNELSELGHYMQCTCFHYSPDVLNSHIPSSKFLHTNIYFCVVLGTHDAATQCCPSPFLSQYCIIFSVKNSCGPTL